LTHHRFGRAVAPNAVATSRGAALLEGSKAICHYCGYQTRPPTECPECHAGRIRFLGLGTEKLELELAEKFPGVPCQRMDSDTMKRGGSHAKVLDAFQKGETKILFGTQMIAKGLDFPGVMLVGVVHADTALHLPDFRAAERTFQLLAQVAGRSGRGEQGGRVLVQSYTPEHYCISRAAEHDFEGFAKMEMHYRKEHAFPPYRRMARVLVRSRSEPAATGFIQTLAQAVQARLPATLRLLGPVEAPLKKLEGYYRLHMQLLSASAKELHDLLRQTVLKTTPPGGVDVAIDIDPMNLL
jgi:primosomal protein N' (replication factor Y)